MSDAMNQRESRAEKAKNLFAVIGLVFVFALAIYGIPLGIAAAGEAVIALLNVEVRTVQTVFASGFVGAVVGGGVVASLHSREVIHL